MWPNNNMVKEFWRKAASQGRGAHCSRGKLTLHQPLRRNAVSSSSRANAVIDFFAVYTAGVTHNGFSLARQPTKNCPFLWGSVLLSNIWLLGPTWVTHANVILIGSAVFTELTNMTNRQTHRQTDQSNHATSLSSHHFVSRPEIVGDNRTWI